MNIVITALSSWDSGTMSNIRTLAEQFSIRHNVLFVDTPLDISGPIKGFRSAENNGRIKDC